MSQWMVVPDKPYAVAPVHLPDRVLEGVDGWQRTTIKNTPITIIPHDFQSWHRLRSRGVLVPSPICRYEWPGPFEPMEHQKITAEFLAQNERAFCLNGLRTGKTLSAIWAADFLKRCRAIRRVLIVAPLFITDIVWERALFQTLPRASVALLTGTRDKKRSLAQDTSIEWLVVNPESLSLVCDTLPEVDLIIVDEFTKFKNVRTGGRKSKRYQALAKAAANTRLWMLSGTPAPQAPTDAYGPVRLVNPRKVSFTQFRDMTMIKVSEFKWVPKHNANETIAQWMQPAICFRREDCIDIPETVVEPVDAGLTAKQRKVIKELVDDAAANIAEGVRVEAIGAASALLKMLQVMAGGIYGDDPNGERATYTVDARPYYEAVESVVQENSGPVIIFSAFQCSVDTTADHLQSQGYRVGRLTRGRAEVDGQKMKSMQLFDQFQQGELDALVAIPQTMQYGLELTRSHTILWATPPFSYEAYDQANARVMGSSQEEKVMILHLIQSPLTQELFSRLKSKEELQKSVLDLIEGRLSV